MFSSNVLTIISFVATLLFGGLSVIFFLRSRQHRRLAFVWSHSELQARAHPDVAISFRGSPVENLSMLRVACWNCGSKEIRWEDIPKDHPPSGVFASDRILSVASVIGSTHNGFQARHVGTKVEMSFLFLNPGDFGLVEVLYEAAPSGRFPAQFNAPVIGALPLKVERFVRPMGRLEFVLFILMPFVVAALGIYSATVAARLPDWTTPKAVGGFMGGATALLLGTVGVRMNARNRRHQKLPAIARAFLGGDLRPNNALEPTAPEESVAPRLSAGR